MNNHTETKDASVAPVIPTGRFIVFPGSDDIWVVRDTKRRKDYPFSSRTNAILGTNVLRTDADIAGWFMSSPSRICAYGTPTTQDGELIQGAEVVS